MIREMYVRVNKIPYVCAKHLDRVPTLTGKPGKIGRHLREKSGNFEQTGKSPGESHKVLENLGNFRQMLFVIF